MRRCLLVVFFCILSRGTLAGEVTVAVAANFSATLDILVPVFQRERGHTIIKIAGSTGLLYSQVRGGAPFDVLLAADSERPRRLEDEGLAVPGSRFTYAIGRLVLWGPGISDDSGEPLVRLASDEIRRIAIANPGTSPYGAATRQVLEAAGLWSALRNKIVQGENINQAFQFVVSGNAEIGFVALSQLSNPRYSAPGEYWAVPPGMHKPLVQDAVLLVGARDREASEAFMAFLKSAEARRVIRGFGYLTPD